MPIRSALPSNSAATSAVSPKIVFKFIDELGTAVTVEGTSLTSIVTALSDISPLEGLNLITQTLAAFTGVVGDAIPAVGAVSIALSAAGIGTGTAVFAEHLKTANEDKTKFGAATSHDVISLQSDAITLAGDELGVVAGVLNLSPLPLTKIPAAALSVLDTALMLASVGLLAGDTQTQDEVKTNVTNYLAELQASLTKYGSDISSAFGSFGAILETTLATLISAVEAVLSSTATNVITNAEAVSSAISNAETAAVNMFNTLEVALHNLTESAEGVSATATSNSCSITSAVDYDQHGGVASGAYSVADSANGINASANADAFLNGTSDSSVSLEADYQFPATQNTQANASGLVSAQQTTIDGVTFVTGSSDPTVLSSNTPGELTLDIPSTGTGDELIFQLSSAGSDQVFFQNGSSPMTGLINYGVDGLDNATISISDPTSNSVELDTGIASGQLVAIDSDKTVGGVEQDFTFLSSGGTLELLNPAAFTGTLSNLQYNDAIFLDGAYVTATSISSDGSLYVHTSAGRTYSFTLDPSENYSGATFVASGSEIVLEQDPTGTGQQSITVTATGTNSATGSHTTYTASVSAKPANLQFAAERTTEAWTQLVPIVFAFTGGNLDPNSSPDQISVTNSENNSNLYIFGAQNDLYGLGPDSLAGTIELYSSADTAGVYTNIAVPLTVGYDEASNDITLYANENVYDPAVGSITVDGSDSGFEFPVIHVGQEASVHVTISNTATGALTDNLLSSPGTQGIFDASNGLDLASGKTGVVTLQAESDVAGVFSANESVFNLTSHDADLPDIGAVSNPVYFISEIYNYAQPVFLNSLPTSNASGATEYPILPGSTGGVLTQKGSNAYNLNFGKISTASQTAFFANVVIVNEAPGLLFSDDLSGFLKVSGGGFTSFVDTGAQPEAAGGEYLELGDFSPDLSSLGPHTLTVVYQPTSVDSGGTTHLPNITLTVTDDVYVPAQEKSWHL